MAVELLGDLVERAGETPDVIDVVDNRGPQPARLVVQVEQRPLVEQILAEADRAGRRVRHRLHLYIALFERPGTRFGPPVFAVVIHPVVFADKIVEPDEFLGIAVRDDHDLFPLGTLVVTNLGRWRLGPDFVFVGNNLERGIAVDFLRDPRLQRHRVELQDVHRLDQLWCQALLLLQQLPRNL